MSTVENPTSVQTGTTPNPFASNTQDFSGSDDDILDNFAEGPDGSNPNNDGVPLGIGGEKGKQAEPASSTLEADIVNGPPTKQPGEKLPPETTASKPEPDQGPAGEKGTETPAPDDETEPEFPSLLLQMAGYADADAAKADGFTNPETLSAFIRGRGQLLASKPTDTHDRQGHPYGRSKQETPPPAKPAAPPEKPEPETSEFKPFELSKDEVEILDESLVGMVRRMNEHNQRQFEAQQKELRELRTSLADRETQSADEQAEEEAWQFDKAVQALGQDWQDVFGEGDVSDLVVKGKTDPTARLAIEYRRELYDAVQAVREVNSQRGFEPMDLQREIGFGLLHRFPDRFQQSLSGNSPSPSGGQRRATLNRPTQRRGAEPKQDPLLNKLAKKYPGHGFTAKDSDEFAGDI